MVEGCSEVGSCFSPNLAAHWLMFLQPHKDIYAAHRQTVGGSYGSQLSSEEEDLEEKIEVSAAGHRCQCQIWGAAHEICKMHKVQLDM